MGVAYRFLSTGENECMTTSLPVIEIDIPVPEDKGDEIDLINYFSDFISDEMGELGGELLPAFNLETRDERATVHEVSIEDVEVTDDGVAIHYSYSYSAYYDCKDMDYADDENGTARGKKVGDKWVFARHVNPEPRSTLDEF